MYLQTYSYWTADIMSDISFSHFLPWLFVAGFHFQSVSSGCALSLTLSVAQHRLKIHCNSTYQVCPPFLQFLSELQMTVTVILSPFPTGRYYRSSVAGAETGLKQQLFYQASVWVACPVLLLILLLLCNIWKHVMYTVKLSQCLINTFRMINISTKKCT